MLVSGIVYEILRIQNIHKQSGEQPFSIFPPSPTELHTTVI